MSNHFQHKNKHYLFIHIPKTAGISICYALNLPILGHHSIKHFRELALYWVFSFTILRNPLTRLYSAYNYLKGGGVNSVDEKNNLEYIQPFKDFHDFVLRGLFTASKKIEHFYPQHYFLSYGNKIDVDYIGSFENLEKSFSEICENIGIPRPTLPNSNGANQKYVIDDIYDKQTKETAMNIYNMDYLIFNKRMQWY